MKKLLYIGHAFHNKTKSSQFMLDLLKTKYDVTKFDFDPYIDDFEKFKLLKGMSFDLVVLWQIMPSLKKLSKYIKYKHINFFPMYDNTHSMEISQWKEYLNCNIINFCNQLHKMCLKCGFSSYYIKYFPKPKEIENFGDPKSLFFWQRINKINTNLIKKVVETDKINKFYIHQVPDPKNNIFEIPASFKDKTVVSNWFDSKSDLDKYIQKSAIYFAPREYEGIGMSFLEAMAMGRCVIAANNPTMNEYIRHGETGFLYDIKNPQKIILKNVDEIQTNTYNYINEGYQKFEKEKYKILDWLEQKPQNDLLKFLSNYFLSIYTKKMILESIFSVKNSSDKKHKIITILGIKIKIKRKNKHEQRQ